MAISIEVARARGARREYNSLNIPPNSVNKEISSLSLVKLIKDTRRHYQRSRRQLLKKLEKIKKI
jgi:hypothetical protein